MSWSSVLAARVRGLFGKSRMERELADEVRFHLEMQAEDHQRAGMSAQEAERTAMRNFGGVDRMKEEMRERRTVSLVEILVQDFSHGARALLQRPGVTVAAALSLALGIGATTAIFTVLNAVALRPLPYPDADRLIWMTQVLKKNSTDELTVTPHFLEWRRQNRTFEDLAGYNLLLPGRLEMSHNSNMMGRAEAMEVHAAKVSASLLPLLGVQPVLGRNFLKQEDYKGRDQVALLGNALWQQRFGGDRNAIGQAILLDGRLLTIVGVLPPEFVFPVADEVQLLMPLGKDEAAELQQTSSMSIIFNVIGRLKPGVSLEQARADLTVLQSRLPVPGFFPTITLKMMTLREHLFGNVKTAGLVLLAAAGFLLLIACANVSNLLLAKWMQRDRELAIRAALGGSRTRLVCQLLSESALLGALACAAGIALAYGARRPLFALSPLQLSGLRNLPLDWRVFSFALAVAMLTIVTFGVIPAFRATNVPLAVSMKTGGAGATAGRSSMRLLSLIAAVEIATVLILSTGAGLMLQSFWKMRYGNLGFRPEQLTVATLNLAGPAYHDPARRAEFIQQILEQTERLPGVERAAVARAGEIPPGVFHATNTFAIEYREQPLGGARPIARYPVVSPAYFAIMEIPLLAGRLLQDTDGANTPTVVVVNRALVRRYFDREEPIGKRVRTGADDQPWRTIVGVVGDVKTSGMRTAAEPAVYLPYRQTDAPVEVGVVLRSPLDAGTIAAEVRRVVAGLDASQPVSSIRAMSDRLGESVSEPRFTTALLSGFAALAMLLGLIGVYGVMGCRIRWQLRELAVRQALGAQHNDLIWHVVRQGLLIILSGVSAGLAGAMALGRLLSGMLYEVSAYDPTTFGVVAAGLASIALLACWIPALRGARSDPLHLLRHD